MQGLRDPQQNQKAKGPPEMEILEREQWGVGEAGSVCEAFGTVRVALFSRVFVETKR